MSFCSINGFTLAVEYGSWVEEPIHVGDLFARTLAARMSEGRAMRARKWSFRTDPLAVSSAADADALQKLIEGNGQSWAFDSATHSLSGAGVTNSAPVGASLTRSAVGGKYGGKLNIGAGGVFGVDMSNKLGLNGGWLPTAGWTLMCWRNFVAGESAAAGFHHVLMKGAVSFLRGASANPAGVSQYVDGVLNNAANLGRVFSVGFVSPYVGLWGYKTDNTTAAIDYDDFVFLPYQVPDAWIPSLYAFHNAFAWSALPRVKVQGDAIPDANPVEAIARVRRASAVQLVDAGVVKNNLRVFEIDMEEWVPA